MNDPRLALVVRGTAALLSFLFSLAAARLLGADGFGELGVLLAVVNVGAVAALLGHESLALRTLAAVKQAGEQLDPAAAAYCRRAARNVWRAGIAAAVVAATAIALFADLHVFAGGALVGCFLIPLMARSRLTQSMLRGVHRSGVAMLPDGVARPFFSLLLVSGAFAVFPRHGSVVVPYMLAISGLLAWGVAAAMESRWVTWRRNAPRGLEDGSATVQTVSYAMFASSLCAVLDSQLPMLVLGFTAPAGDAGLFAAAERLTQPTALIAQTIYVAIAGRLAFLHAQGDHMALRRLVRRCVQTVSLATVLVCGLIAIAAKPLLGLFGESYVPAAPVLYFLLAAATVDAAAGPTGMLLLMLGAESQHLRAMLVALAFQLLMLLTLPPILGPIGAGAAVLASKFVWNTVMLYFIWRRFRLGPLLLRA